MNIYKIHMVPGFLHVFYLCVHSRILMLHHQDNIMETGSETVVNISKTLSFTCHLLAIHNCSLLFYPVLYYHTDTDKRPQRPFRSLVKHQIT